MTYYDDGEDTMSDGKDAVVQHVLDKAAGTDLFTEEEIQALKEIANTWRGLAAFGRIASFVRSILAYLGWLAAAYLTFKFAAADWVKGVITPP